MNKNIKDEKVINLLTQIDEIENLLNNMFKAEINFSFSKEVVFQGNHINKLIKDLISASSEFIINYKLLLSDKNRS